MLTIPQLGIEKTIYAPVLPETENVLNMVIDGGVRKRIIEEELSKMSSKSTLQQIAEHIDRKLLTQRESVHDLYRECWKGKQDEQHELFFDTWKKWSSPVLSWNQKDFPHYYPISGANEGIRYVISAYKVKSVVENFVPRIHVFSGEYEGFQYYADLNHIEIVYHDRSQWRQSLHKICANDQFYISQPSSLDGNVWDEFQEFTELLTKEHPGCEIILDLTYVGAISKEASIEMFSPSIKTILFSLSKPMGVYYHRIGGCFSRESLQGLTGNKWFKNLLSLKFATELMNQFSVYEIPKKYAPLQKNLTEKIRLIPGLGLTKPSDVWLISTCKVDKKNCPDDAIRLLRGHSGSELVRMCLTPGLYRDIHEKH